MKQKDKSQVDKLPVLPLPMIEQDLTRVIPCYRHSMLQGKHQEKRLMNSTHETKDNFFNQTFSVNNEIGKNSNWTSVGLTSFEDKFDPKISRQWIQLEEETYESVNVTPLPPFFRLHMPCLSVKTNNSTRPLCVVRGAYRTCLCFWYAIKTERMLKDWGSEKLKAVNKGMGIKMFPDY